MPAMTCPQTSVKVVGGCGTSVAHMLVMALDDPSMDAEPREILTAHEIEIEEEWANGERGGRVDLRNDRWPRRAGLSQPRRLKCLPSRPFSS